MRGPIAAPTSPSTDRRSFGCSRGSDFGSLVGVAPRLRRLRSYFAFYRFYILPRWFAWLLSRWNPFARWRAAGGSADYATIPRVADRHADGWPWPLTAPAVGAASATAYRGSQPPRTDRPPRLGRRRDRRGARSRA